MTVRTLKEVPGLGGLYAKAVLPSGGKKGRAKAPEELEFSTLEVPDVPVPCDRDDAMRIFVGGRPAEEAFFGHLHSLLMPLQMELMTQPKFPLPMMGLIHTTNTWRQLRPVPLDSEVDLQVTVAEFRPHRVGTEVLLVSQVLIDGQVAAEEETTYLAKGVKLDGLGEALEAVRPEFETPMPTALWKLDSDTGREWAKLSGDINPIHINPLLAKGLGMPGMIAHGMYTASRALSECDVQPGTSWSFDIEFAAPVVLPTKVPVAITRAGVGAGGVGGGAAGAGARTGDIGDYDVVAWHGKKKRPHFTGRVRKLIG
ncbi:MaoC/PaaZ C-terminal domain-containing protein [Corynebacterium ulceribovis]|uniref:MaoC/PaaZ C-terminal domain-containing protein n=1 Tax=Corynebacterium ulceribovis TaxID=487732 RepID=UPI000367F103|nr:MaoC/PaaZ C-terminal domain-containing protein [Corynebacterium ulceribovis]